MKGSIKKRGNTYTIIVDIYNEKGERKKKWIVGYKRKKDAEADLPRIISEINGGVFVEERKITFIEYADKWLNYV